MKEKTLDLMRKALGEESHKIMVGRVERETGKKFATGKSILEECEEYEHLIEREGEAAFMERVRIIVAARESKERLRKDEAQNTDTAESDITT